MTTTLDAALAYFDHGYTPVPVPMRSKRPVFDEWQKYAPDADQIRRDFSNGVNVGLLLGAPSRNLVDVDLDCREALILADAFLPETLAVSGRKSSRRSHRWYIARQAETAKFPDPIKGADGKQQMIVELRSTGCQTIAPPSTHEAGEAIEWEQDGEPSEVEPEELRAAVARLAACALIARHWPARGSRHEAALALAGTLLRGGWSREDAVQFVCRAAEAAGDEEWRDRASDVETTAVRLERSEEATGRTRLAELLDPRVVAKACDWLGIRREARPDVAGAWPERRALPSLLIRVPSLDPEILPAALRPWLIDVAERMQVPLSFAAVPALVAAGAVVGRQLAIQPLRHDRTWSVVPNLWGGVVARAGALKSPTTREAMRPLRKLAEHAREQFEKRRAQIAVQLEEFEAHRAALRQEMTQAAKKSTKSRPLEQIRADLLSLEREAECAVTRERRYYTSDPTTEKLGELLRDNPRGMLLLRDELSGWLRTLDREGREGDRELYLESWSGDASYTIDRIKRGTLHIFALCVSIFGSIQPGKLESYVRDAVLGGSGDDGLLQRFQLLVYPDLSKHWKKIDRAADEVERARVTRIFERLDTLDARRLGAERRDDGEPAVVRFDTQAQAIFDDWHAQLERRLRGGEFEHEALASHLAKYRSLMPALALVFHAIEVADDVPPDEGVPEPCASRAVRWCEFLEAHARRIYSGVLHRDLHAAHALARRIERGEVQDGIEIRWIYRRGWSGLSSREDVEAALAVLHEANWIRTEERKTTGRPSEVVRLHPELLRTTATDGHDTDAVDDEFRETVDEENASTGPAPAKE